MRVVDVDLQEMNRDGSRTQHKHDQRAFYRQLLWIVRERGWKLGWAGHKFQEKFGDWPQRSWQGDHPMQPEPETRSWVHSRFIAWKKAQAKTGAPL